MKKLFALIIVCCLQLGCSNIPTTDKQYPLSHLSPDRRYGELFKQIQMAEIFSDSKTFVDSTPNFPTEKILRDYAQTKDQPQFSLRSFVATHFSPPPDTASDFHSDTTKTVAEHIETLWPVLTRTPDDATPGSLIPLPHDYVVPGGRFREIYYWDSYFTMLGLQESGRWDLIEAMVDNFSHLIDTMGFIPNGNRTYYQTRSQPPFYSLMVKLLAQEKGSGTLSRYRPYLLKEYEFWMNGSDTLTQQAAQNQRVVLLADNTILNRYWDNAATPRPESYREDVELIRATLPKAVRAAAGGNTLVQKHYRDIRAAAESGWDFSSRWLNNGSTLASIHTTDIIPIDLNALLYHLELTLADAFAETGDHVNTQKFRQLAQQRKQALMQYCWSEADGFFYDYNFVRSTHTSVKSLAAMFPLFFEMVEPAQAERVAQHIRKDFLTAGGVTTTLKNTGQQWDAPNGWAPLQWITIQGLRNYQELDLADTIKQRWIALNTQVYERTGKLVEKYNVYDVGLEGGGGEYPVQDGFGWTNGVLLKLLKETPKTTSSPSAKNTNAQQAPVAQSMTH